MQAEFTFLPPHYADKQVLLPYRALAADGSTHEFTERITFSRDLDRIPAQQLAATLRLLSLAAGLSYYKAFAPAPISVAAGLNVQEHRFLRAILRGGLGEFAFVNNIPEALNPQILALPTGRADAATTAEGAASAEVAEAESPDAGNFAATQATPPAISTALCAIGGGKDSIVSLLALQRAGVTVHGFAINPKRPMLDTADTAQVPLMTASRQLDPHLFELNKQGYPNGHVPVTAINSLIAVLTAWAHGLDAVIFSNEAGASYGNVSWHGYDINHQWSKSSAFEALLRESLPSGAPQYCSLLRPLNEIRIARNFAKQRPFHRVFTSCNRAFTMAAGADTSWCGECPKCQFIFLMLAPFLPPEELTAIFGGRNLFDEAQQVGGFLDLMGEAARQKPFECVGEPLECRVALTLAAANPAWQQTALLQHPAVAALYATEAEVAEVFAPQQERNFIPANLLETVREI
ncbi:hypothetical protein [Canibacter oris]|uniref:UDP-N-acetyl-alpha-D-muramoyl-L-alanyl-L-glutamate epimerase n=1 Tax=Canibacter oris TaxID=1365628 RepID=A0A840DIX5_9MICO|nr:hypothetical protein [Canibacter oris]MBB4071673.1 hypothetical protein [Canibacter oris]